MGFFAEYWALIRGTPPASAHEWHRGPAPHKVVIPNVGTISKGTIITKRLIDGAWEFRWTDEDSYDELDRMYW